MKNKKSKDKTLKLQGTRKSRNRERASKTSQFDMDSFKPSEVIHKQKYSIYGGKENGKFWKKYVCGGVRLYYYNVNTKDKIKYEKVIRTMKILNID
jgi:hypothetical protein